MDTTAMSLASSPSAGYLTKLSTCKTSPKFSFGGRPSISSKYETPGPGSYGEESLAKSPSATKFRLGPSHVFGTAERLRKANNANPGPGAYQPQDPRKDISASRGFGKSPRQSVQSARELNPGPGAYNPATDKALGSTGPKYSASPRPAERRMADTPGPGAYKYDPETMVAHSQQARPRSPQWGFSTSPREGRQGALSPGPGAYNNSHKDLAGPKYTMRTKQSKKPLPGSPGPGAYDSNVTSFGY